MSQQDLPFPEDRGMLVESLAAAFLTVAEMNANDPGALLVAFGQLLPQFEMTRPDDIRDIATAVAQDPDRFPSLSTSEDRARAQRVSDLLFKFADFLEQRQQI